MALSKHSLLHTTENRIQINLLSRQSLAILQMPQAELSEWLLMEIEKNPLLELDRVSSHARFEELLNIEAKPSLYKHVMAQIREHFFLEKTKNLAVQVACFLDERGYLASSIEEIAKKLNVSPSRIASILSILQDFDPPGLFARNLRECLLLQLQKTPFSLAHHIVKNSFHDLLHGRFEAVKKKNGLTDLKSVLSILAKIPLRPSKTFEFEPVTFAIADLSIVRHECGWIIEPCEQTLPKFHLQTNYLKLDCKTPAEQAQLQSWISSAKWIMYSLKKRKKLLLQIGVFFAQKQRDFLLYSSPLNRLTIKDLASHLHLHNSTISRALSGKHGMTPQGLIPLKSFITNCPQTKSAKQILKKLIAEENPTYPLSDKDLSEHLKKTGFPIARRTVAKYRKQLKIRSVFLRNIS